MNEVPSEYIRTKADELAIERGAFWDEREASKIIKFAERVFRPQYISKKFKLLEWQVKFLKSLYGWRNKDGTRRWKYAVLHIPKKNGVLPLS